METDDVCAQDHPHQLMNVPMITCLISKAVCVPAEISRAADAAEDDDGKNVDVMMATSCCPTLCTYHLHNLPLHLCDSKLSLSEFRRLLKTHLFR